MNESVYMLGMVLNQMNNNVIGIAGLVEGLSNQIYDLQFRKDSSSDSPGDAVERVELLFQRIESLVLRVDSLADRLDRVVGGRGQRP
jgi:archaellum component FlaC